MKLLVDHLNIPSEVRSEWGLLEDLVRLNPFKGPSFTTEDIRWVIKEKLEDFEFFMERNKISNQRRTLKDPLGCIGFSVINHRDDRIYLTEGVSDYFTVKLTHPGLNVLGLTNLGGNRYTKAIIETLFRRICIVSDNDFNAKQNTGLLNSQRIRNYYESRGCKCKVLLPEPGFKDITEQFISQIKLRL